MTELINAPKAKVTAEHELPTWLKDKAKGTDGALYEAAYKDVSAKNHYQKGEGPIPAMARLKEQGMLSDLTLDDITKEGRAKAKHDLGRDGALGRNFYKSSDAVLDDNRLQREVSNMVEKGKQQERQTQSERLAPSADKIKQALTPELETGLKKQGLETDPAKIRQGIVDAMKSDSMPTAFMQKRGDGDFPIMAGYIGTGAINNEQRQQILDDQKQKRSQWRSEHPDAEKGAEFKQFQTGDLLRERFGKERIDAADALLTKLQPERATQK